MLLTITHKFYIHDFNILLKCYRLRQFYLYRAHMCPVSIVDMLRFLLFLLHHHHPTYEIVKLLSDLYVWRIRYAVSNEAENKIGFLVGQVGWIQKLIIKYIASNDFIFHLNVYNLFKFNVSKMCKRILRVELLNSYW